MAKEKILKIRASNRAIRNKIRFFYLEKFFNKWMNKYDFPQLNYQQKQYLMKKYWAVGTIAISSISSADETLAGLMKDGVIDMGENNIIFTPWAVSGIFNIYDYPTKVRLINVRNVPFITNKDLEVDKEVIIGFAQKNHKSVFSSIEAKLDEIVDLEMKKRVSLKAQSQPWMFTFAPEDYEQAKVLQEQLDDDNPYLFVPLNEVDRAKGFSSGAPYIVDKIQNQIDGRVNEILTLLGCNNIGITEKKEHLVVDEINANNQDIQESSDAFTRDLENLFARVEDVFGYHVDVIDNSVKVQETNMSQEEPVEDENDGII